MSTQTLLLWAEHLATLAANPVDAPETTPVIPPALARWRGVDAAPAPAPASSAGIDDALWALLVGEPDESVRLETLIGDADAEGPIHPDRAGAALEVWTERELSALHALLWLGRGVDKRWIDRAFAAARWHVEETQPDNATNRPWAVHLFVLLSERDGSPEARLYAETLLSNSQVAGGRPDALSALILADAGDALVRAHNEGAF